MRVGNATPAKSLTRHPMATGRAVPRIRAWSERRDGTYRLMPGQIVENRGLRPRIESVAPGSTASRCPALLPGVVFRGVWHYKCSGSVE
jgi:hypothetical protein